jgi:hypothetical protein
VASLSSSPRHTRPVVEPRVVEVGPERLPRWLAGFVERHGEATWSASDEGLTYLAADGARASFEAPFLPLPDDWPVGTGGVVGPAPPPGSLADVLDRFLLDQFVQHATRRRVIGVLLVRLGGYAAGVFDGDTLVSSKVGSRQVHGRSSAGGWSQQRFARRREGQVKVALDAAVRAATLILVPKRAKLDVVVTGGDRPALRTVLADPALAGLLPLVAARVLDVPDPRARVLRESLAACRAVKVRIQDPG